MTRTKRWILAFTGILLVGIGALGAILPGLPTTIFLLGASWCFARSCPWLEERLMRNRFFAPYMRILDGDEPMTNRARVVTIAIIWTAITISLVTLHTQGLLSSWSGTPIVVAGVIGSIVVWRFRRQLRVRVRNDDGLAARDPA
ncbi:MAG: YbaN family protein [Planctomycetota bacterium]